MRAGGTRWDRVLAAGGLIVAVALAVWQLDAQGLWYDETMSVLYARADFGAIPRLAARDLHPPLSFLVLHGWVALAGTGDLAVRFPSVMASVVAAAVAFQLGRHLGRRPWSAPFACLLMAVAPASVYFAHEARMYTLVIALAALGLWLLLEALTARPERAWPWWMAFAAAATAGLYTHYVYALILLGLVCGAGVACLLRRDRRSWFWLLATGALAAAAFVPWLPIALDRFGGDASYFPAEADLIARLVSTLGVLGPAWQLGGLFGAGMAALAWGLAAVGLVWLWVRRPPQGALLTLALVIPFFAYGVLTLDRPKVADRYLIGLLPFSLAASAGGWGVLIRRSIWVYVLAAIVAVGLLAAGLISSAALVRGDALRRPDVRGAARTIAMVAQPGDVVLAVGGHGQVPLRHYLPDLPVYGIPDIDVFDLRAPIGEVAVEVLNELRLRYQRLWLVLWQRELGDPSGVVLRQLETTRARQAVPGRYHELDVVLFDLSGPAFVPESARLTPNGAVLDGRVELVGADLSQTTVRAGSSIEVTLGWRARQPLDEDLNATLQLLTAEDRIVGQTDQRAGGDAYQSRRWPPGVIVIDRYRLVVGATTPPGTYRLIAALYRRDGQRLTTERGVDAVTLATVEVRP